MVKIVRAHHTLAELCGLALRVASGALMAAGFIALWVVL